MFLNCVLKSRRGHLRSLPPVTASATFNSCADHTPERRIGFQTIHTPWPWLRQTPAAAGIWGDCRFIMNPPQDVSVDWLVVYDDLKGILQTAVPVHRRICVISEPPSVKTYSKRFLNQFGHLISPFPVAGYRGNMILSHSALPWHFGVRRDDDSAVFATLEDFANLARPDKQPLLSVVCSDKVITPEHRARLVFLDKLKHALGDRIVHFGRGFQSISDKAEAILPYQFHLVLENNRLERGWTEKLADAWLGWAFPFFSGGPNLHTDFPEDAFVAVDIDNHAAAIAAIARVMAEPDAYQARLPAIAEARRRILKQQNLFALLGQIIGDLPEKTTAPTRQPKGGTVYPARLCIWRRWICRCFPAL